MNRFVSHIRMCHVRFLSGKAKSVPVRAAYVQRLGGGAGALQRIVICCSILQCVTVLCSLLQKLGGSTGVLQCVAVCCSLQCVAEFCSDWEGAQVRCNVLQYVWSLL